MYDYEYAKELEEALNPPPPKSREAKPCNNREVKGKKKKVHLTISESEDIL